MDVNNQILKSLFVFYIVQLTLTITVHSQSNYKISGKGLGTLQLAINQDSVLEICPVSAEEEMEFIFKPNTNSYSSMCKLNLERISFPGSIQNVFFAKDSLNIIKKIIMFVEGNENVILKYFDERFEVSYSTWKSAANGRSQNEGFIWNTKENTSVSMINLSSLYGESLMMVEFFLNDNSDYVLSHSIIKVPLKK